MNSLDPLTNFCPECGEWFSDTEFDEVTGWCVSCSSSLIEGGHDTHQRVTASVSGNEQALAFNAERVEYYIQTGQSNGSVWAALQLARQDRPTCVVCGERMTHAKRGSVICRRTPKCRRVSRRYVYLYTDKGMNKVQALATILSELT